MCNKRDILREEKHILSKTFIFVSIFTLLINFIFNLVKTILDLRLINIIENCERKQKTKTRERKQKYQIKFDIEQECIKNRCRKQQTTNSLNKEYFCDNFRAYIYLFDANNNFLLISLSNSIRILFDKSIIINSFN